MNWPFPWWRERHKAREKNAEADAELATSRKLQREDREQLAEPLEAAYQRNMFSDMIRDALVEGYLPARPHNHGAHSHSGGKGRA